MKDSPFGVFERNPGGVSPEKVELDVMTIRLLAYRSVQRVRMMQKMGHFGFEEKDGLKGLRVVVSSDGGRVRLRENKRGPKTKKGRNRYKGAWREPKLLLIYVVDTEGKQSRCFAPVIDGILKGPDAFFALLGSYLRQLHVQEVEQLLFISDLTAPLGYGSERLLLSIAWASIPTASVSYSISIMPLNISIGLLPSGKVGLPKNENAGLTNSASCSSMARWTKSLRPSPAFVVDATAKLCAPSETISANIARTWLTTELRL